MRIVYLVLAVSILASCATRPENISAAYYSESKYEEWQCDNLELDRAQYVSALASASDQQNDARTADTLGIIFIGLPVSTLAGSNVANDISRLKGEIGAVDRALSAKKCLPTT